MHYITELFFISDPYLLCSYLLCVTQIIATEMTITSTKATANSNIGITKAKKNQKKQQLRLDYTWLGRLVPIHHRRTDGGCTFYQNALRT